MSTFMPSRPSEPAKSISLLKRRMFPTRASLHTTKVLFSIIFIWSQSEDVEVTRGRSEDVGLRNGGLNGRRGASAPGCLKSSNKASHNSSWSKPVTRTVTRTRAPDPLRAEAQFLPYSGTDTSFPTFDTLVVREYKGFALQ